VKQTQCYHEILALLDEQGFLSTEAFVETFNLSPQTIRRDLNELAKQGLISRHHGGASLYSSTENEAYSTRKSAIRKKKPELPRNWSRKFQAARHFSSTSEPPPKQSLLPFLITKILRWSPTTLTLRVF
jgi:predicted transcriptional regulator